MAKILIGNFKGPKGDTGPIGLTGPQGPNGATGMQGTKGEKGDTGATGAKGEKGEQGIQGLQGIQGEKGQQGATGPQGTIGPQGERGSQWYSGTGITGNSTTAIIFTGSGVTAALVNDYYLNTTTGYVYRCTVSGTSSVAKWVYSGNIRGATGPQGAMGPQGEQGPQGALGTESINFTEANSDLDIVSGESASTLFGKILKNIKTVRNNIDKKLDANLSGVYKIPMNIKYRAWQGVTIVNDLIHVFTDRNENFELENIISVYSLDGQLINEKRNAYTGKDSNGKFMSFGDGNLIDNYIFIPVYNVNSGGNPLKSKIVKYSISDLSIVGEYDIGGNVAESVTKHNNSYWVVYHDVAVIRQYDLNFTLLKEYPLTVDSAPHGYFQGSLWDGDFFYAVLHGHNSNSDRNPFAKIRKYRFDGSNFNYIESISPPTIGCGQGIAKYKELYYFSDRPNNMIIISKTITARNIYPITLSYQKEFSIKPTLLNGWEPFDLSYDRTARATIINGVVYLSGIIKNPTNLNAYDGLSPMFQLPPDFAPKYSINVIGLSNKGILRIPIVGRSAVNTTEIDYGNVNVQNIMGYTDIGWISLDGICFPLLY